MTEKEIELRKKLRAKLEAKATEPFFDKHGNETKCLTVTEVMRILLEDGELISLQNEFSLISDDNMLFVAPKVHQ